MTKRVSEGDLVICWGVGFYKKGELGAILEIDHSRKYPYRIKGIRNKGNGIWCPHHDFKVVRIEG